MLAEELGSGRSQGRPTWPSGSWLWSGSTLAAGVNQELKDLAMLVCLFAFQMNKLEIVFKNCKFGFTRQ